MSSKNEHEKGVIESNTHQLGELLVKTSVPYIEELLFTLGREKGYVLMISDNKGVIIELFGDEESLETLKISGIQKGISLNEKDAGTNAVGAALKNEQAKQVLGNDHQLSSLKPLVCSAAPVFDANNQLLGSICLAAKIAITHPHTFGLVISTAKAIENKIHNSSIQQQLFDAQQYAFSIMNQLSYGLIAFEKSGIIRWVNDTACRSINIRRLKLIDQPIEIFFPDWKKMKKQIDSGEVVQDYESEFLLKNHNEKYLINAFSIQSDVKSSLGYVITFRPFSRVMKLVARYAGSQLNFTFDSIIHRSKKMKSLIDYARTVANTPSTILITGESGTGKEVFAQAIHNASERKNNNFIAINCGAITPSLIESELFGYEEGAFTDAHKGGRPGKFEIANQGTIFLDEIGDMPLDMQVKLLRTLQEKTITRVGGNKEINIDIRIIAATNKDLMAEVSNGNFREDLFYRISVIPITLPPLRERKMDIPPLFRYFLSNKASKLKRPVPGISHDTMKEIVQYDWPGNIRELENFAEKVVAVEGRFIENLFPKSSMAKTDNDFMQFSDRENLPSLEDVEKQTILQYLDITENNISKTANALGIGRNTLYKKLEKYNISIA